MAPSNTPSLFVETRLDLDEAFPGSTIELDISSSTSTNASFRSSGRRALPNVSSYEHEDAFASRRLASDSSIFFRRAQRSPRAFLWRIIDERNVLEIQTIDLSQDRAVQSDASLTLRLRFPNSIRPYGVAFADPEDRDALAAFVLTTPGDLYTLNLKREMFVKPVATETSAMEWCKLFQPTAFSFRTPYKLFAVSTLELVVSLHDGSLMRLVRKPGDDGSNWRDTFFQHGGGFWGLGGLIPFQGHNTVRFDGLDLEATTSAELLLSPDGKHFITVGLDHMLRTWNIITGKIGVEIDLLGNSVEVEKKTAQYLIDPSQTQIMQLVDMSNNDGILYYVVAFSTKGQQFKVWGILDGDAGAIGVRDMCDEVCLMPPLDDLMDASVWTMEEFHVNPGNHWRETELWLRARSGPMSKVYTLKFDLFASTNDLQQTWQNNWVSVDPSGSSISSLNELVPFVPEAGAISTTPTESAAEQWIDFLFYPGRFSKETLATALNVWNSKMTALANRANNRQSSGRPVKQQIVDAVLSAASSQRQTSHLNDFYQQEAAISAAWRSFYELVRDLQKRKTEHISFVYDRAEGVPWLISADSVSPIRECSDIEVMRFNSNLLTKATSLPPSHPLLRVIGDSTDRHAATLLHAARQFRQNLPKYLHSTLKAAVAVEVLEEPSESIIDRLQAFDSRTSICTLVSDDDYAKLTEILQELGGYEELDNTMFMAVIDKLGEQIQGSGGRLSICRYGAKELITGTRETIRTAMETLLDLLVLVVFLALELEPSDLSPQFNAEDLFVELVAQLRDHLLLEWMSSTMRSTPSSSSSSRRRGSAARESRPSLFASSSPTASALEGESHSAHTVMESIFIGDWSAIAASTDEPRSRLLTYWCRAWTYGPDLGRNYDEIAAHVLSHLVRYGDVQLATDFEKFVLTTPWAGYVKGRLAVLRGEYDKAALLFTRSSFGLGKFGNPPILDVTLTNFKPSATLTCTLGIVHDSWTKKSAHTSPLDSCHTINTSSRSLTRSRHIHTSSRSPIWLSNQSALQRKRYQTIRKLTSCTASSLHASQHNVSTKHTQP